MDEDLKEFEEYMEEIYDFNLLDLLEDINVDMLDSSRVEVDKLLHKGK